MIKNEQHLNADENFDHQMSLSKIKCLHQIVCKSTTIAIFSATIVVETFEIIKNIHHFILFLQQKNNKLNT